MGRIYHLLSNMELSYFYILDWSDKVCDIREQYPLLDIATVLEIADKAGIRYPFDNVSGFPYVLTSDFLITTPNGEMGRNIKKKKDPDSRITVGWICTVAGLRESEPETGHISYSLRV